MRGITVRESKKGWIVEGHIALSGLPVGRKILIPYSVEFPVGTALVDSVVTQLVHRAICGAGKVLWKGSVA